MSDWLEHVREKYEQIDYYKGEHGVRAFGIGMCLASVVMLADNLIYSYRNYSALHSPAFNGDMPDLGLPVFGITLGFVIYGLTKIATRTGSEKFNADMKQVELEQKRDELGKEKTAAVNSLDEKIAAIEKSRVASS